MPEKVQAPQPDDEDAEHPSYPDRVTLRDLYDITKGVHEDFASAARAAREEREDLMRTIDRRFDAQGSRLDTLVNTTNHRLDDFTNQMESNRLEAAIAVGKITPTAIGAISAKDVAGILVGQLTRSRLVWFGLVAYLFIGLPVVVNNWAIILQHLNNLPFHY